MAYEDTAPTTVQRSIPYPWTPTRPVATARASSYSAKPRYQRYDAIHMMNSLTGGFYRLLQHARFHVVQILDGNNNDAAIPYQLPAQQQASAWRADLLVFQERMNDHNGEGCWIQFNCVPSPIRNGDGVQTGEGYRVAELREALAHHDNMYQFALGQEYSIQFYKSSSYEGRPIKDTWKVGPHYYHHMDPLEDDFIVPTKWYLIVKLEKILPEVAYEVTIGANYDCIVKVKADQPARVPTVRDFNVALLKEMYFGAAYYLYLQQPNNLDLLQVMHYGKYDIMDDNELLCFHQRSRKGVYHLEVQLLSYERVGEVIM